jgi:putative redox protein
VTAGGEDSAPTPTELFVASIAGCAAFYGRTFLARRGLPDRVDVAAGWEVAPKPDRVERVSLVVTAPGVPPDRMEAFQRVIGHCLVHQTLKSGCDVRVEVHAGSQEQSSAG